MIINQVGGGKKPTGTKTITSNGTHDVAGYANADVQVPTTAPAHYVEKTVDANGILKNTNNPINTLSGVTDVDGYGCYGIMATSGTSYTGTISLDASSLTTISGESAFAYALYGQKYHGSNQNGPILDIDFRNVETISGLNAFAYFNDSPAVAGRVTQNINFNSLRVISGSSAFYYSFAKSEQNSGATTFDFSFPNLEEITGNSAFNCMFSSNQAIKSFSAPKLTKVTGSNVFTNFVSNSSSFKSFSVNKLNIITSQLAPSYAPIFASCLYIETVEFGGLTASTFANAQNQLQYLFKTTSGSQATNGCTVHFPANFDPTNPDKTFDITTLAGYPTFGGDANYIHLAYDLPATE